MKRRIVTLLSKFKNDTLDQFSVKERKAMFRRNATQVVDFVMMGLCEMQTQVVDFVMMGVV